MKHLFIILALLATALTGCDDITKALQSEPSFDLKVGTEESPVGTWLTIKNMGEKPVSVKKVTINKKYVCTEIVAGYMRRPWNPDLALEMGQQINPIFPDGCPQPVVVEVETDQGAATYKFE